MADLSKMRQEYTTKGLHKEDMYSNPFAQFESWFNQAVNVKLIEPNAFTLTTVGKDMNGMVT
jgi:pyridoxamine 5'-phosphate oxidase